MGLNYKFTNEAGISLQINIPILNTESIDSSATTDPLVFAKDFDQFDSTTFIYPDAFTAETVPDNELAMLGFASRLTSSINCISLRQLNEDIIDLVTSGNVIENSPFYNGDLKLTFFDYLEPDFGYHRICYKLEIEDTVLYDSSTVFGESPEDIHLNYIYAIKDVEDFKENKMMYSMRVFAPNSGSEASPFYEGLAKYGLEYFNVENNAGGSIFSGWAIARFLYNIATYAEEYDPENPYEDETEGETGGSPTPPIEGGVSSLPLPTLSLSTYAYNLYRVDPAQLRILMRDLWSESWLEDLFDTNEYKLSNIVSLHILPFTISTDYTTPIKIGNKTSDAYGHLVSEYHQINLGSVYISKLLDNYMIHEPYTSIELYLPYVGMVDLCPSKVTGRQLKIMYNVHIPTGYGIASVWIDGNLYSTYTCNMYTQCPISANSNSTFMSAVGSLLNLGSNPSIAGSVDAISSMGKAAQGNTLTKGTYGSVAGFMNLQKPYIIRSYPNLVVPKNSGRLMGKPTYKFTQIKNAGSGFLRVDKVKLDGIKCSDTVKSQIEAALVKGVYW